MAGTDDIAYASAAELHELYRRRAVSPVEVATALLDRAEALQRHYNAFVVVDRDGALAAARASERRWTGGEAIGRLDGVPATIKDLMLMRGFPTRRGSQLTDAAADQEDSPATARLREAGAVLLGKTTTPEFGWKALGDSPLTGITRNPWNPARSSGGSSAGAAVAAAAGIGVVHLGSDGAGSIRTPSAFCGTFGIKPSFGRVPAYPASALGPLSHVGPMTRSVTDAALMLTVLSGADDRDPYALPPDGQDFQHGLDHGVRGWRIGFSPDLGYARVDPEIAAAVAEAAQIFARLGATVEPVAPLFPSPRDALFTLWSVGIARVMSGFPKERLALADPGLIATAQAGAGVSAADYVAADVLRGELGRRMAEFHRTHDLLILPTMPVPALPVGQDLSDPAHERHWIDWSPFSYPFNMTRQPAASICCGLTAAGLPIGLQIVGPLYAEARVLRAARAFEQTQPVRRPPLA